MAVSLNYLLFEPSLPPIPSEGGNAMSRTSRLLSIHFGFPMPDDGTDDEPREIFRYAMPITKEDGERGGLCAATGYWFPARLMMVVDGKRYGLPFAPQPQPANLPREEWGIPEDNGADFTGVNE